jgi:hypothetical protein
LFGCLSSRSACFHEIYNPHSQRARIWSRIAQAPAESTL